MDPISQVLSQQTSGSASGQGFGQFFLQGRQLQQNERRLNLSSRHLELQEAQNTRLQKRDDMLLPLEQQEMQGRIANLGITGMYNLLKAQSDVQQNAALPEIMGLQIEFGQSPNGYGDEALTARALSLAKRFPRAFAPNTPGGDLLTLIQSVPMIEQKFKRVIDMNKQLAGSGVVVQSATDKGGLTFMNEPKAANLPANIQEANEITRLETLLNQTTDPAQREQISRQLRNIREQTTPRGLEVTLPDGTRISQGGSGAGKQPAAITTKAEQVANSAASMIEFGHEIISSADQGNVGVQGNLKRLWAEVSGQVGDAKAGSEFEFSQAVTFFRAQAQQVLKSDSQMAEAERKMIIQDLPSEGILESDETAKKKARDAMRKVAESARRQVLRAGVPLPDQLMTPAELIEKASQKAARGEMSLEDAMGDAIPKIQRSPFAE